MSTTFYESPEDAAEGIAIDVTHGSVWFFQRDTAGSEPGTCVTCSKEELPAIYLALRSFLAACGELPRDPP